MASSRFLVPQSSTSVSALTNKISVKRKCSSMAATDHVWSLSIGHVAGALPCYYLLR